MNTKQTEALKLALEALESAAGLALEVMKKHRQMKGEYPMGMLGVRAVEEIEAVFREMDEALAEQPAQEQEPVAIEYWLQDTMESGRWVTTDNMAKATAEKMLSGEYGDVYPQGRIVEPSPPASKPAQQQEPVGWLESPHGEFRANQLHKMEYPSSLLSWKIPLYAWSARETTDDGDELTIAYMSGLHRGKELALAEQPAQQQEPVAYMNQNGVIHPADYEWEGTGNILTPLYTSPPASKPWVGLTDEERDEIYNTHEPYADLKAVEAKLREKNA